MSAGKTLYDRLGGYDAVTAVAGNLLPRLMGDALLGRFWRHRGDDGGPVATEPKVRFRPETGLGRDVRRTEDRIRPKPDLHDLASG